MTSSVAFVATVKTLGPLFTIGFSMLFLGERLRTRQYASVIPVMLGVAITTITEVRASVITTRRGGCWRRLVCCVCWLLPEAPCNVCGPV